jgi:hypothetical protein
MGTGYQIDHFIAMACYGYSGWVTHPTTLCLSSRRNIFTKSKKMKLPAKSGTCFCRMRPKPSWAMTAWVSFLCNISLPRALPHYFRGQNFHIRGRSEGAGLIFHSGLLPRCVAQKQVQARTCTVCFRGASALWVFTSGHLTSNLRWNEYMEVLAVAQQGLSKHNYYCLCLKTEASKPCKPNKAHGWVDFFPHLPGEGLQIWMKTTLDSLASLPALWGSPDPKAMPDNRSFYMSDGMQDRMSEYNRIYMSDTSRMPNNMSTKNVRVSEYVSEMSRDICRSGITILAPE